MPSPLQQPSKSAGGISSYLVDDEPPPLFARSMSLPSTPHHRRPPPPPPGPPPLPPRRDITNQPSTGNLYVEDDSDADDDDAVADYESPGIDSWGTDKPPCDKIPLVRQNPVQSRLPSFYCECRDRD